MENKAGMLGVRLPGAFWRVWKLTVSMASRLIATMLGRLRMSVPQCLEIYKRIGNDLFGHKRSMLPLTTKYHHRPLEEAVKGIVRRHCKEHLDACEGDDWHPWRVAEDGGEEMEGISSEPYPRDRICQS